MNILNGIPINFNMDIDPSYQNYSPVEIKQGSTTLNFTFNMYNKGEKYILPNGMNIKYILACRRSDGKNTIREATSVYENVIVFSDTTHFLTDKVGILKLCLGYQDNSTGLTNFFEEDIEVNITENPTYKSDNPIDYMSVVFDFINNANSILNKERNITNDTNITEAGYALDARQNNPDIKGSLSNILHNFKKREIDDALLPDGIDIFTCENGVYCVVPGRVPEILKNITQQGEVSKYGTILFLNCGYPILIYVDVFGKLSVYSQHYEQWKIYSTN